MTPTPAAAPNSRSATPCQNLYTDAASVACLHCDAQIVTEGYVALVGPGYSRSWQQASCPCCGQRYDVEAAPPLYPMEIVHD